MQIPSSLQSSLLGQNQKGDLAGHLLSSLTTYKYPEHGPSVLEVVDIQKVPTLSGHNAY
jgi:iron(III) transport system ATP-binding protein